MSRLTLTHRFPWILLIVGATFLLSRVVTIANLSPLLAVGAVGAAAVGGLVPGVAGTGLLLVGVSASGSEVGATPFLSLLAIAGVVGLLANGHRARGQTLRNLQETIQRLVDERVEESAATNRELSLEFTERLRVEETLRIREVAMESMLQGIVITDARRGHEIVYANEGFTRLTGYLQAEILNRNCRFMQGPETSEEKVAEIRRAIREERSCVVELVNYRKDASPFWNALTVTPIRNERGECTHYVGIQMDVTDFKRIEEQFHQSQKMEAIGHLASGVAHDFNNLLTVINGCGELLRYSMDVADPNLPLVAEINQAGERAAALTRQLLTFSRKSTVQPRIIDLNAVVGELDRLVSRLIGADVRLKIAAAESLPKVKIDPGLFEQAILNLVVNARDAMPHGGELTILTDAICLTPGDDRLQPGQSPGEYVLLSVADTGTGIDKATLPHLFEPFFTTKPAGKGTGLGLATVYGIVKSSDGFISVTSQLGKGTTFTIHVPICPTASDSESEARPPLDAPENPGIGTILLVEDEPGVRSLARHALQSKGYRIVEASNGREALSVAASLNGEVDLLLTDVVMPEMGGRELSEQLRREHPDLRVVFMSGYNDDAVLQHGISQSEMHFLQKPFSMNDLIGKVRGMLDESMRQTVSV